MLSKLLFAFCLVLPSVIAAQSQELGLTLGGLVTKDRSGPAGNVTLGSGTALQANYGIRIIGGAKAALFGEGHLLANPQRLASVNRLDGQPNGAPRTAAHGVFDFGGGVDVKIRRFVSARGEIRDFCSGSPGYNIPITGSGQHSVVAGGGFVLRFGKE